MNNCRLNGRIIESGELLWDDVVPCDSQIVWSQDKKQVALAGNKFDRLMFFVSDFSDIKTINKIKDFYYPSNNQEEGVDFLLYWSKNNELIFEPSKKYEDDKGVKESLEKEGLVFGKNILKTR